MEIITNFLGNLSVFLAQHVLLSYLVLFFGSYFETIIGVGFFIYGEIFFIPGALLAGAGVLNIWLVAFSLITGGVLGDQSSYFLGRHYGMSVFKEGNKIFSLVNYEKGKKFYDRFGPKSLLLARIAGPFSWITPFLSGVYDVPYRQFVFYNTLGVIVGIGQFLIICYFFGSSYQLILDWTGKYGPIVGVGIVAILIALYFFFKKEKELIEE